MTSKTGFCLASILCSFFLGAMLAYWYLAGASGKPQSTGPRTPVILITPATHPSLEVIEQAFIKSMKTADPAYEVSTFNANGNQTLLRSQVEEAINQEPALIMTIATGPTLLTRELLEKKGVQIPHIFAAVSQPEHLGLIPEPLFNGTVEESNYALTMEVVPFLVPGLKRLLLVYNPQQGTGFKGDLERLQTQCTAQGVELTTIEVFGTNEVYGKTASVVGSCDAVVIFKDNTTASAIDALVKLCQQHQVPLITHHLDAAEQGASICFGSNEADYGTQAAVLAHQLLKQGKLSTDTFTVVSKQLIKVNPDQNLHLPQPLSLIVTSLA